MRADLCLQIGPLQAFFDIARRQAVASIFQHAEDYWRPLPRTTAFLCRLKQPLMHMGGEEERKGLNLLV
ncbi:hypothetical protein MOF7_26630 [Methylobacterium oryzae]